MLLLQGLCAKWQATAPLLGSGQLEQRCCLVWMHDSAVCMRMAAYAAVAGCKRSILKWSLGQNLTHYDQELIHDNTAGQDSAAVAGAKRRMVS